MDLARTLPLYTGLLVAVATGRLIELAISRHRRGALLARGAAAIAEPRFAAMVLLHAGVLVASGIEAHLAARPAPAALAGPMLALLLAANALRWWVIAALGPHWNVRIVSSLGLGVVTEGPFRFIRHPNYVAVFVELLALPLVHAAYATAVIGAVAHAWVLWHRIRAEEAVLMSDPAYRALMGAKPRFLPFGP